MAKPLVPKTIFSFSVSQHANERQSFFTSAGKKSPHCGDLRGSAGSSAPAFHLQTFFASGKALPCRYLLQAPSFSLRPKSWQIRSKLPCPATTPPALQSGTQGQTGCKKRRTFLARLFLRIFILYFVSDKVTPDRYLLQTPPFYLCPKSGQIRSKLLFPATTPPTPQSGTQGQTGRKKKANLLTARLAMLFSVL